MLYWSMTLAFSATSVSQMRAILNVLATRTRDNAADEVSIGCRIWHKNWDLRLAIVACT